MLVRLREILVVCLLFIVAMACGDDGSREATTFSPDTGTETSSTSLGTSASTDSGTSDASHTGSTTHTGETDTSTVDDGTEHDSTGTTPEFDGEPGEFTLSFDGRAVRIYVPSGYTHEKQMPLVIGLHGAGDTGGNFYAVAKAVGMASAAEPAQYILMVPDTKSPYSDFVNWSGNPNNDIDQMLAEMDDLLSIVDELGEHYHLDPNQLHVFGFSNGGLFAAITGMARADHLATLAVIGYGWGSSYLPPAPPSRPIPVQFGCGTNDGFHAGAQQSEAFLAGQGHDTRLVSANSVGHMFSGVMGVLTPSDLFAWMHARPLP